MHILLSNDDGIQAPGLRAMCLAAVAAGHRVSVCAPDRERSAASHGATLATPLHPRAVDFHPAAHAWAVDGTPADCARMGLFLLKGDPVDLVIAGINRGPNLGGACVYSGTIAAAMEAAMSNVPALAVSLCTERRDDGDDYTPAARVAMRVADWMAHHPLPRGAIYSLNVPVLPYEAIRGIAPAHLSPMYLDDPRYQVSQDDMGICYYYCNGEFPPMEDPAYDVVKIRQGIATITKLTWNFRLNGDDAEIAGIKL